MTSSSTTAPPCPPLPRRPSSRTIRALGEGHWPFFRRRRHGRTSPELALVVVGRLRSLPTSSSARMGTLRSRSVYLEDIVTGFAAVEPKNPW